jgi:hypothetical protein
MCGECHYRAVGLVVVFFDVSHFLVHLVYCFCLGLFWFYCLCCLLFTTCLHSFVLTSMLYVVSACYILCDSVLHLPPFLVFCLLVLHLFLLCIFTCDLSVLFSCQICLVVCTFWVVHSCRLYVQGQTYVSVFLHSFAFSSVKSNRALDVKVLHLFRAYHPLLSLCM